MDIKEQITKIDSLLSNLKRFNLGTPRAINLEEEKQKFFFNKNYNPVFNYPESKDFSGDVLLAEKNISDLPTDLRDYFLELMESIDRNNTIYKLIGTSKFADSFQDYLDWDLNSIDVSKLLPKFPDEDNSLLLNANEIKDVFVNYIKNDEVVSDWTVSVENNSRSGIFIMGKLKTIVISNLAVKSEIEVERLVLHEIITHGYRAANNSNLDLQFIKKGFGRNVAKYSEGLAVFNEISQNRITKKAWSRYLLRFNTAKEYNHNFVNLYNIARNNGYDEGESFDFAYRFKRGIADTSELAINLKDAAYIVGYNTVKSLDKERIKFLYSGNVEAKDYILKEYSLLDGSKIFIPKLIF